MFLIKSSYEILDDINRDIILKKIELAGRTCYKSEDKITSESASKFVKMIVKSGHLSVIEHVSISVKFICDRGVTHELVRHRIASYSHESTRYCNYSGGLTFILPLWFKWIEEGTYTSMMCNEKYDDECLWLNNMLQCEERYKIFIKKGWKPQQARSVLPNSLKTEIVTTCNLREWKHIFDLRCSEKAHPQIREIMVPLKNELAEMLPEIYG